MGKGRKKRGDIHKWWLNLSAEEKTRVVIGAESSLGYLWQVAWRQRKLSPEKARKVVEATKFFPEPKRATLSLLRPDIWPK